MTKKWTFAHFFVIGLKIFNKNGYKKRLIP